MKKINVIPGMKSFIYIIATACIIEVFCVCFSIEKLFWFVILLFNIILLILMICISVPRAVMTVEKQNGYFESKAFRKSYCKVYENKVIYYAFSIVLIPNDIPAKYIIISNFPICFDDLKENKKHKNNTLIAICNLNTQIVMPYNKKTKPYLNTKNWVKQEEWIQQTWPDWLN